MQQYETIDETRVVLTCDLPLNEILVDFSRLKSITHGYGSMDYDMAGYAESSLVKWKFWSMQNLLMLSHIVHRDKAETRGEHSS